MAKVNNTFISGKMNSDLTYPLLSEKDYVRAENLRISGMGEDGRFNFLKGSERVSDYSENGQMIIVGMYEGNNNKLYYFLAHSNGKSKIVEYDVETKLSKIIIEDNNVLRFDLIRWDKGNVIFPLKYLLSIDQIGDLLIFSNEVWEYPRVINLKRNYSEGFTREDIVLAKKPPKEAPKIINRELRGNSSSEDSDAFVSFAYRYKYLDGDYSALSFYTDINSSFITRKFKVDRNRNNKGMTNGYKSIELGVDSGGKNVTDVEVYARESGSNTAYLVYSVNKVQAGILDNTLIKNIQYKFSKNYEVLNEEATKMLYSNIPKFPKTQTAVGNRLIFGNYHEGYDIGPVDFRVENVSTPTSLNYAPFTTVSLYKYKVGVVYYNDYNESTTVLLPEDQSKSEVEIGFENRLKVNSLRVAFPQSYQHPAFATKMKFVVKSESLGYEILYTTYSKKMSKNVYLYLTGDNINRVHKGDTIIRIDRDENTYREFLIEDIKMMDKKDGFSLAGQYAVIYDTDNSITPISNGNDISTVYNAGPDAIDHVDDSYNLERFYAASGYGGIKSGGYYYSSIFNRGIISKSDIGRIYEGDVLDFSIVFTYMKRRHKGNASKPHLGNVTLSQSVYASQDYDSLSVFFNENLETTMLTAVEDGAFCYLHTTRDFLELVKSSGIMALAWAPNHNNEYMTVITTTTVNLRRGNRPLIFRTKSKENLETFYYESPKTYLIANGSAVPDEYNNRQEALFTVGFYNGYCWGNGIESYKIKDGFNARAKRDNFRANSFDKRGYKRVHRKNDITYSGIYNYELGVNELSVFNPSLANWLTLPIRYGEIQRAVSTDGNITVFQNNKVVDVMYGKSIMADLQGNETLGLSKDVLGGYKELPYEYGISENPESVAVSGRYIYFTDKNRSRFLIKAGSEIQEINADGFYREGVEVLKNNQSFLGSFDDANGEYIVTCSTLEEEKVKSFSLAYSMNNKGFTSYYTYQSDFNFGMNGKYFSTYKGVLYQNEVTENYNDFTGQGHHEAKLTFVVAPSFSTDKVFKAVYLQSNTGWDTKMKTNLTATSFSEKVYEKRESYYYTDIHRDNSTALNIVGIGTIKDIQGNILVYENDITNQVSVGETLQNEALNTETHIVDIQGNSVTVENASGLNIGDFTFAKKKQEGGFRPNGAPIRGEWLEVTLSKKGGLPYYITAVNTEVIPSKL